MGLDVGFMVKWTSLKLGYTSIGKWIRAGESEFIQN